jgi:hypothetical protein
VSADVLMLPGPEKGECGCGCGAFGTLKRPSADGTRCVARQCKCKRCIGRANKRRGQAKQRQAAKALGVKLGGLGAGHEENWRAAFRTEVKATKRHAGPVHTAYLDMRAQSEASRPIGDHRPFVATVMPPGVSYGLLIVRTDDLSAVIQAFIDQGEIG